MGILFLIFNLLTTSPAMSSQNQLSRQNASTAKVVNVGNTIVAQSKLDGILGLIR
jgi:hypothetical protein